ncbi:MAG TPA: glutamine--fructose-6-phosphate transaminase (isomerizing) [Planctomycetota bacterium]|nr:glutamine--fructose-6-phosphate transaminase (isomerizing) [Planctomycetota bacterium]
MCGIVGYTGRRSARNILIEGLKRLEYRGYDSAGIVIEGACNSLCCVRSLGRISELEAKLNGMALEGTAGIAHTRWATHGAPSEANAHPHADCHGNIFVVHNGIVENCDALRAQLQREGHTFTSETDTEVIAHLIEKYFTGDLTEAVRKALKRVIGTYGLAVLCKQCSETVVVARNGSPMVVGIGDGEYYAASDVSALIEHTKQIVYLDDNEVGVLRPDGFRSYTIDNIPTTKSVTEVTWDVSMIDLGGHDTYMAKEIHEQPETIRAAFRGRLKPMEGLVQLGGLMDLGPRFFEAKRIIISACGTAWHAGLIGEYMIEDICRIPVEVSYASEFRYRNPIVEPGTIVIVVSQSGETADTLAALREAKRQGAAALAISNVVGSTIARESDAGVYIHAGPEIGVASTKAFTSQVTTFYMMSLMLGRARGLGAAEGIRMVQALEKIPDQVRRVLKTEEQVQELAKKYYTKAANSLFLGRGYNFPVALEGALKLKEISYVHAEGYPAAEMKHGPIALITEAMPVVFIAVQDSIYDKILVNMSEVKARGGKVIAVATEGDTSIKDKADDVIYVPPAPEPLTPLLTVVPLQLLAYHVAKMKGCDVDKPRNLAKSVTVE